MQESDRSEFEKCLAEIFAAIDKPLGEAQREAFWRGLRQMSLVEFSRCRDKILADLAEGETPRKFGVSDIWVVKGKLRAALPMHHTDDGWRGDDWLAAANGHLLGYIRKQLAADSMRYGAGPSYGAMTDPARKANKTLDAAPDFVRNVNTLVKFKNLWADQMRLSATADGVPITEQREVWAECMKRAEAEISAAGSHRPRSETPPAPSTGAGRGSAPRASDAPAG